MTVQKLRDTLLSALSSLPGTRQFHIHVLVSSPRKHGGLFPYAHPRPRVYLQDILILLSEQSAPGAARVLVAAVEASLYNIPVTSCGILYVSKVDSSGQGQYPSPTSALLRAFLAYFADPATRPIAVDTLWIQLFARAQGQYLFPNSSVFPGKKPLSDIKLCAWWKRIFSEAAGDVRSRLQSGGRTLNDGEKGKLRLFYVLPGYSELEAQYSLKINSAAAPTTAQQSSTSVQWSYGHQYSQTEIPLPCPRGGTERVHLGHYIPWFDDDPKSRFLDDLAHTTEINGVQSPKKKRPRISLATAGIPEIVASTLDEPLRKPESRREDDEGKGRPPVGELDKVTPDEFWERMPFRQECISSAITGFFALGISTPSENRPPPSTTSAKPLSKSSASTPSPLAPQAGQVALRLIRRVISTLMTAHEFSTTGRAIKATETLEESIKGLCDNIATVPVPSKPYITSTAPLLFMRGGENIPISTSASTSTVPLTVPGPGPEPSRFLEVPRTPPRRTDALPEISPNPFPEPVASLDTYHSHIYGSISVSNPAAPPKKPTDEAGGNVTQVDKPVTVLAVRKKRKPESKI